jgi:hypothetical protein
MAVYIDKIHMVADTLQELHQFAAEIGLARMWFHGVRKGHPHYDLGNSYKATKFYRNVAVHKGAIEVSSKEILLKSKSLAKPI